ncbi:methyltransferase domain-containing protein [Amphritea sp.]|uniref:methyltransferase domain-containing protein n=1 Tax=Amphritea sp. TaxID=1872502 RepID=UPI003A94AC1C
MSRADLWNHRYLSKDISLPALPAELQASLDQLPPGRTLDLACGDGAASLYLAAKGHRILAVDFAVNGLQRLQRFAAQQQFSIATQALDLSVPGALDQLAIEPGHDARFDNVVILRYLPEVSLLQQLPLQMAPAGRLLIQTFNLEHHRQNGFPERFCLSSAALVDKLPALTLLDYDDGRLKGACFDRYLFGAP